MSRKPKIQIDNSNDNDVIKRLNRLEIDNAIEEGISKWIRTICITSTTAAMSFFMWLGSFAYHNSEALYEGIKAFIQTGVNK